MIRILTGQTLTHRPQLLHRCSSIDTLSKVNLQIASEFRLRPDCIQNAIENANHRQKPGRTRRESMLYLTGILRRHKHGDDRQSFTIAESLDSIIAVLVSPEYASQVEHRLT